MAWSDGITTRIAVGSSRLTDRAATAIAAAVLRATGSRMIARGVDAGALELLLHQEAMIVVAQQRSAPRSRRPAVRRFSVAPRKLELWPLKKRMNCFGYMARDSGHSRVPEPPERMTGCKVAVPR